MKKFKILFLAISLMHFLFVSSQEKYVFENWTSTGGQAYSFLDNASVIDGSDNIIMAGACVGSNGFYDIIVLKVDGEGNTIWEKHYNGAGSKDDMAVSIAVDDNDNVYITGIVYTSNSDSSDCITIKYNSSGIKQWEAVYNGTASSLDFGTGIIVDDNYNVYVTGVTVSSSTLLDVFVIKYDNSGSQDWIETYDYMNLFDISTKIEFIDNNIFITGGFQNSANDWEYGILEYDENGILQNSEMNGGSGIGINMIKDIAKDDSGYIYVTGNVVNAAQNLDIITVKLDTILDTLWTAMFNGSCNNNDGGYNVEVDNNGNVYVAGYTYDNTQESNFVTIKYNSSGVQQWVAYYNGPDDGPDTAFALKVDDYGNVYVAGNATFYGNQDYYTIKYASNGDTLWSINYNGLANKNDKPTNIWVNSNDTLVVIGMSEEEDTVKFLAIQYIEKEIIIPPDTNRLSTSLSYIKNCGQVLSLDSTLVGYVHYYTIRSNPKVYFADDTIFSTFSKTDTSNGIIDTTQRVDLTFSRSNSTKVYSIDSKNSYYNFYFGHIANERTRVPTFEKLFYPKIYDNIDILVSTGNDGIKYYFIINPTGNPEYINLNYNGYDNMFVDGSERLNIVTFIDTLIYNQALAYQVDNNGNKVSLGWQPTFYVNGNSVTFTSFGSYNANIPLILQIDINNNFSQTPLPKSQNFLWSSFIGGYNHFPEHINDIVTDNDGNVYLAGYTADSYFPTIPGMQNGIGYTYAFIIKLSSVDCELKYGLLFGHGNLGPPQYQCRTTGSALAHHNNDIFLVGYTTSYALPQPFSQPSGSYVDTTFNGSSNPGDGFIAKFSDDGVNYKWFTYYGDSDEYEFFSDIKVDISGSTDYIYIVGNGGPNTSLKYKNNAHYETSGNGLICKFTTSGIRDWVTLYGGTNARINSCAIDNSGNLFVSGFSSGNLVGTVPQNAYTQSYGGGLSDAIIGKFLASDNSLYWSTYYGGTYKDVGKGIEVNSNGDVFITGETFTSDNDANPFPLYNPYGSGFDHDGTYNGNGDAYILQFDNLGIRKWASYIGTGGYDMGVDLAVDEYDNVYISGTTNSSGLPTSTLSISNLYTKSYDTNEDMFLMSLNKFNKIAWSTYIGGIESDINATTAVSIYTKNSIEYKRMLIGGSTKSLDIPFIFLNSNSYWQNHTGYANYYDPTDAYIAMFDIQNMIIAETDENLVNSNYELYPNPSRTNFNIRFDINKNSIVNLSIYNSMGQVVYNEKLMAFAGTNNHLIVFKQFPPGIYIIRLYDKEINLTGKVTKF
ncbi:SBBP repeat-containing protein [candidate division KSB1 bacterium]